MTFFVGTIGVNWLQNKTQTQIKIHLCHVAAHIMLSHYRRGQSLVGHPAWDYACDLEANHLLLNLNPAVFKNLKPVKRKWMGLSAEEIFFKLAENDERFSKFGDNHLLWKELRGLDERAAVEQSVAAKMMPTDQLNNVLSQHKHISIIREDKSAGYESGGTIERISIPTLKSVRFHLKSALEANITKRRGFNRPEYDFLFLWQRRFAEVSLPLCPRQIVVTVDTSGSISSTALKACAALARYIVTSLLSFYPTTEICVALVDADLQCSWSSKTSTDLLEDFLTEMRGRGGTKIFLSTQKFLDRENLSPDAIIIISDFETSDSENDLKVDAPLLGIIINDGQPNEKTLEDKKKKFNKVKFIASLQVNDIIGGDII